MRKALVFVMVLLVFCCSVFSSGSEVAMKAVHGVYDGFLSAVASYLSEPRIALQGVTAVSGDGSSPLLLSFVRSDVSTYADSLAFFGSGMSYGSSDASDATPLPSRLINSQLVQDCLRRDGFRRGEVILDGSVRVQNVDDSAGSLYLSISMMVSGTLVGDSAIMEGGVRIDFPHSGMIMIRAEGLTIDGEAVSSEPFVLPLD